MRPSRFSSGILQRITVVQIAIIILSATQATNGAKILFFVGWGSHSHRVAIQPLATKLAENGHQVTFLTPLSPEVKNPNITEFCPKELMEFSNSFNKGLGNKPVIDRLNSRDAVGMMENFGVKIWDMSHLFNEKTLRSPDFAEWLEKSTFDLVITEHPKFEVAFGIAYKFGAKVIGFEPSVMWAHEYDEFGIPTESSWYTSFSLSNFYKFIPDRFHREYNNLGWHFTYRNYFSKVDSLLQEVIDKNIPPVRELIKNMSLLFINSHFSTDYAKSLPPFVVPVGGMHVQDPKLVKPLPKEIEDFIKTGDGEGFVYISFGSLIRISGLPPKTRTSIFDSIGKFSKARFLIKWNDEIPDDMPKNVLPMKWFPQQDILAHPKCRGFISQGGLMSIQQASFNGVPVVITPVFGDQPYNARSAVHHNSGIHLELSDITFETFSDALGQLLYNETLSAKAKEVGRLFRDRPMTPLQTAVWWTEYVLRHDTAHLKPLGINQEWWQRRLLDFWATVYLGILLCTGVLVLIIRSIIRLFSKSKNHSVEKVKKH